MPDPTRPVAGAPIDTDWGQQVHDRVFQPPGCIVAGGVATDVNTTFEQLQLNTAVDDPGGWLSSDTLTVPTGRGGLYTFSFAATTDDNDDDFVTIVQMRVNGTNVCGMRLFNEGASSVLDFRSGIVDLAAGDQIEFWAKATGSTADVIINNATFLMVGTSIGA